jgi:hypothetical protein
MGMFDDLICEYPLPVEGANDLLFQTKSLVCWMEKYKIDAEGNLWHLNYETEDRSDPNAEGVARLFGVAARVNEHWVRDNYLGEIRFYTSPKDKEWIEFSAYFVDGVLKELHQIEDR